MRKFQQKLSLFGEVYCNMCGKILRDPESIKSGLGKSCANKLRGEIKVKTLDKLVYLAAEHGVGTDDFLSLLINTHDLYKKNQFASRDALKLAHDQINELKAQLNAKNKASE
jgi:hypothetical protein